MSDLSGNGLEIAEVNFSNTITVICSHCDREESGFSDRGTAQAWFTGHIHAEHMEKLPSFANVEDRDE
jgi:hypothetical protein